VRCELKKACWDRSEWGRVIAAWQRARKRAREAGHAVPGRPKSWPVEGTIVEISARRLSVRQSLDEVDCDAVHHALILVDFGWGVRGRAVGRSMAHPMVPEVMEGKCQ
jgi:hypothetical protein